MRPTTYVRRRCGSYNTLVINKNFEDYIKKKKFCVGKNTSKPDVSTMSNV